MSNKYEIALIILIIPTLIFSVIYWFKTELYYKSKIKNLKASIELIYALARKVESSFLTECEYERLITFIKEIRKDEI